MEKAGAPKKPNGIGQKTADPTERGGKHVGRILGEDRKKFQGSTSEVKGRDKPASKEGRLGAGQSRALSARLRLNL